MFEHVIRTPFDMKPVFKPCERPTFNANHTDIFIQAQKRIELESKQDNSRLKRLKSEIEWISSSPKARQTKSKARIKSYNDLKDLSLIHI